LLPAVPAAVRATYERRLRAKLAGLKVKRSALLDEQMEAQQNFHRNRNPSPAQSADFRAAMETFAFRLSVVEARIGEENGALAARMAAFVDTLRQDQRLQSVYDPRGYIERMEREGVVGAANHSGKREILVGGGVDRGAFEPGLDD
jgi:hypothetical protein